MLRARFSMRFKNPFLPCRWHSSLARASFALFNKNLFPRPSLAESKFRAVLQKSFLYRRLHRRSCLEQDSPWDAKTPFRLCPPRMKTCQSKFRLGSQKTHFRFLFHSLVGVICTPNPHSSILQISQPQPFHKMICGIIFSK